MGVTMSFLLGALLGFCIGAFAIIDIFLVSTLHELRKGRKR